MTNTQESDVEILMKEAYKKSHRGLKVLLLTSTIMTFMIGLFAPFFVLYAQNIAGGLESAGTSLAVFSIVSGVLILAFSVWESSVKNKKNLYIAGQLLRALVFVLYMYVGSYFELLLVQFLLGISAAFINPSFDALFTEHLSKDKAISEWGGWEGLTSISTGAAALLGSYVITNFGFDFVLTAMATVTLFIALYLIALPREVL